MRYLYYSIAWRVIASYRIAEWLILRDASEWLDHGMNRGKVVKLSWKFYYCSWMKDWIKWITAEELLESLKEQNKRKVEALWTLNSTKEI